MAEEYSITVTGASGSERICVLQESAGAHPFVAWHGITAVNRFWFWDALWPLGAVALVGLPGHGPVPPPSAEQQQRWTPDHFIEIGLATLRQVAGGRPATLIGHSTGGMVALGIAQRAPELVARLILVAPVVWSELSGIVALWQRCAGSPRMLERAIGLSLGAGRRFYPAFLASLNAFIADRFSFYANPKVFYAIERGYIHMQQTPLAGIVGTTRVLCQADLRPEVQRRPTSVPTLIIHGERDPIVPIAQSRWLAAALPHATLHAIPGAGHLVYGEQEALVNQHVLAWLQQHPPETSNTSPDE